MEQRKVKNMWQYALLGMLTTIVVLAFARLSYGVILPFMREGLHLSYKQAGYLGTTTSLGYLSTLIFAGFLTTKWGGKKTILLGISLVSLGLLGLTVTPNYGMTFIFMLLLGIGTSFTYTPLISLLVAWFPLKKGTVIGLTTSGAGIGILIAGILVPILSSMNAENGWRLSWLTFALIGIAVTVLIFLFIQNPPLVTGESKTTENPSFKKVYRNPRIINVGLIYGIIGITYIIQMIFIMSYMVDSGIDSHFAGSLMALNGVISIFSGPIWGAISDYIGRRTSLILTMGLTLLATALPIFFPTMLGFTLHMIIISCTSTGLFTLTQALSMDHVKPSEMSIAFSYVTFYFAVGQFVGPTIAGWLIEDGGGFQTAFIFSSVCLVAGVLLTLKVKTTTLNNMPSSSIINENKLIQVGIEKNMDS